MNRGWALLCLALAAASAAAGSALVFRDLDGAARRIPEPHERATVLFFVTTDCPIANRYAPEINRIQASYAPKGIAFCMVYVDPDASVEAVREHARAFGFRGPVVRDADHALVRRARATVTPEAAVFGREGRLLYRGRIDDRYVDYGKARREPTTRDLRRVLDAVLRGEPVPTSTTRAIGCFIPTGEPGKER